MANYTRTNGANARAQEWDDFEEEARPQRSGLNWPEAKNWLPLEALEEEVYFPGPQLRPVAPQPTTQQPQRASRPERHPEQPRKSHDQAERGGIPARFVAMLAGGALAALAAYAVISAAVEWTQVKLDDFQYGRPRTTQIDAFVGHSEVEGVPSHFIAMNLNRRVTVMELPGGDSTKAATIVGPYLYGDNEDLTPVQIGAQDVNGDGKPDLIVNIKSEQLIYLNDGAAFKLITPQQQADLRKSMTSLADKTGGEPITAPEPSK